MSTCDNPRIRRGLVVTVDMPHGLPSGKRLVRAERGMLMVTPDHVPRMRLVAYVSEKGDVQRVDEEGYAVFSHVFASRPSEYRYAVVEVTEPPRHMLIDMYDLYTDTRLAIIQPGWTRRFDTEDGALMAGVLARRDTK